MKTITNDFKEALKNIKQISTIITYLDEEQESVQFDNDTIQNVGIYWNTDLLKSCCKMLDLETSSPIPKGTELNISIGLLVDGDYEYVDYGKFYTTQESEYKLDTETYLTTAYDAMVKFNIKASENPLSMSIGTTYTLEEYLQMICNKCDVTYNFDFTNNTNADIQVIAGDPYVNNKDYTYRDILDDIAECLATNFLIDEHNRITNKNLDNTSQITLNADILKSTNVNVGEMKEPITGLQVYGGSTMINYAGTDTSVFKIKDNNILMSKSVELMPYILSTIEDNSYYSYSLNTFGVFALEPFDYFTVTYKEQDYLLCSLHNDIHVGGGLEENIAYEFKEEDSTNQYMTSSEKDKVSDAYIEIDKQNATITSTVNQVTEQNNKIAQITQTVDEINSKISDIADITISGESEFATFTLDNINASEPIQIKVKPVNDNISYLYPNTNLYPSSSTYLKVRTVRFHNNTTDEDVDYVLPDDLLIYDSTHYDEFYLDYDSQTCQITKRCEYNADGSVGLLASEEIVDYPYPTITLEDGDYTLTLLGYEYGYLFIRLMAKNIYTTQFYTKAETESRINQKASEIELGVDQTLTNYSTTSQMNSAINLKANEITSTVSATYETKSNATSKYSQIQQTTDSITSTVSTKVGNNEIISKINQSPEAITINAGKISLAGKTINLSGDNIAISSNNFTVDNNGNMWAQNANITGTIWAGSGSIGGWNINSNQLQKTTGNYSFEIRTDRGTSEAALLVYDIQNSRYNWYVRPDGYMYARNADISGHINATSGSFTGSVNATSGTFNGTVKASAGNIGGWTITSSGLSASGSYGGSSYSVQLYPWGVQAQRGSGPSTITLWWNL